MPKIGRSQSSICLIEPILTVIIYKLENWWIEGKYLISRDVCGTDSSHNAHLENRLPGHCLLSLWAIFGWSTLTHSPATIKLASQLQYLPSIIKAWNPFLIILSLVWNTTNIWFPGTDNLVSFICPVTFATISESSLPPLCILRKSLPFSSCHKKGNKNC